MLRRNINLVRISNQFHAIAALLPETPSTCRIVQGLVCIFAACCSHPEQYFGPSQAKQEHEITSFEKGTKVTYSWHSQPQTRLLPPIFNAHPEAAVRVLRRVYYCNGNEQSGPCRKPSWHCQMPCTSTTVWPCNPALSPGAPHA